METQAYFIKTDGELIPVSPKNKVDFSLEELQSFVGGLIEFIYLKDGRIMVVNEDGIRNELEVNKNASILYLQTNRWIEMIVGDVLVTPSNFIK
jgi:hypothetical protein